MGHYSIKDLEKLSGIKAHTIRIWEKRYGLIVPDRTDTNIRTYSDDELKKLLNVSILNSHGIKISKIANLRPEDMNLELNRILDTDTKYESHIDSLVVAMVDLDRRRFEKILADCNLRMGFEDTCIRILYPFLQKVGLMWQTNAINPAQEHFISNLIRQKLFVAIDELYDPDPDNRPKVVMALPEGEMHELGLLFYRYLMERRGFNTIYLGQSVPFEDLVQTVQAHRADYMVTAFVACVGTESISDYVESIASRLPTVHVIATGGQVGQMASDDVDRVDYCSSVSAFISLIEGLRDRS
ncbi:MAG: MerR family transcriptional regulator [Flavobacteriales bacterium]|nr:MerR family transcriptional regulator [Flavobacteriales bacterium]